MQIAKKILYSGTDDKNNFKNGYIDAETTVHALEQLKAAGLSNIIIHNEPTSADRRQDLIGLNDKELARRAALEIKARSGNAALAVFIESCRNNIGLIVAGLLFFAFGIGMNDNVSIFIGSLLLLYIPVAVLWNRKDARLYNNILASYARGEWSKASKLIKKMKKSIPHSSLAFDLDARMAYIEAVQGNFDDAIKLISKWQLRMSNENPGLYESRLSSIYFANKDYSKLLECIRLAHTKCPESAINTLDLAFAEVRYGNIETAKHLLNDISVHILPVFAIPFLNLTKGVIALKTCRAEATGLLTEAQSSFIENNNNPVVWPILAVCSAYLAQSLHRDGRCNEAMALVKQYMPILKVHADEMLLADIREKFKLD